MPLLGLVDQNFRVKMVPKKKSANLFGELLFLSTFGDEEKMHFRVQKYVSKFGYFVHALEKVHTYISSNSKTVDQIPIWHGLNPLAPRHD